MIQCLNPRELGFVVDEIAGCTYRLSMHPYGSRVLQRLLEKVSWKMARPLLNELKEQVWKLYYPMDYQALFDGTKRDCFEANWSRCGTLQRKVCFKRDRDDIQEIKSSAFKRTCCGALIRSCEKRYLPN